MVNKYIVCLKKWIYILIIHNVFLQSAESENSNASMVNGWNILVFKGFHAQNVWKTIILSEFISYVI